MSTSTSVCDTTSAPGAYFGTPQPRPTLLNVDWGSGPSASKSDTFYAVYNAINDMTDEQKEKLLRDIIFSLPDEDRDFVEENLGNIACYYQAHYDELKKEQEYHEKVLQPAFDKFNELEKSIHIAGFEV